MSPIIAFGVTALLTSIAIGFAVTKLGSGPITPRIIGQARTYALSYTLVGMFSVGLNAATPPHHDINGIYAWLCLISLMPAMAIIWPKAIVQPAAESDQKL